MAEQEFNPFATPAQPGAAEEGAGQEGGDADGDELMDGLGEIDDAGNGADLGEQGAGAEAGEQGAAVNAGEDEDYAGNADDDDAAGPSGPVVRAPTAGERRDKSQPINKTFRVPKFMVAVVFEPLDLVPTKYAGTQLCLNGDGLVPLNERKHMVQTVISERNIAHGGVRTNFPQRARKWTKDTAAKLRVATCLAVKLPNKTNRRDEVTIYEIDSPVVRAPKPWMLLDDKEHAPMILIDGAPVFSTKGGLQPDGNFSANTRRDVLHLFRTLARQVEHDATKSLKTATREKLTPLQDGTLEAECLGFRVLGWAGTPAAVQQNMIMREPPRIALTTGNVHLANKLIELSKANLLRFESCPITVNLATEAPELHTCGTFVLALPAATAQLPLPTILKEVARNPAEVTLVYHQCSYSHGQSPPDGDVLHLLIKKEKVAAWEAAMKPAAPGVRYSCGETLHLSMQVADHTASLWRVRPPASLTPKALQNFSPAGCRRHRLQAYFEHKSSKCPGTDWKPRTSGEADADASAASLAGQQPGSAASSRGRGRGGAAANAGRGRGSKRDQEEADPRETFFPKEAKRPRVLQPFVPPTAPPAPAWGGSSATPTDLFAVVAGVPAASWPPLQLGIDSAAVTSAAPALSSNDTRGRNSRGRGTRGRGGPTAGAEDTLRWSLGALSPAALFDGLGPCLPRALQALSHPELPRATKAVDAQHPQGTPVYDHQGRFIPEKFEEVCAGPLLFTQFDLDRDGALTAQELVNLAYSKRNIADPVGWVSQMMEWGFLFWIAAENGKVPKESVRKAYDGTLFFEIEDRVKQERAAASERGWLDSLRSWGAGLFEWFSSVRDWAAAVWGARRGDAAPKKKAE
eukprot:tig00021094_g18101.t1